MGRSSSTLNRRDAYLLRVLGERRYLTLAMLHQLFFGVDDRTLRAADSRIATLLRVGYLKRSVFIPLRGYMGKAGRKPYVYWLSPQGKALVERVFEGEKVSLPPGRGDGAYDPRIEHTLAVNALWIDFVLSWRAGGPLVAVRWMDEWRGAVLELGKFKFQPDAFVSLTVALQGAVPPLELLRSPMDTAPSWYTVEDWAQTFPDAVQPRGDGQLQVLDLPCFVEIDQGKSSKAQLNKMLGRYQFLKKRSEWVTHYNVPWVGQGAQRRAMWPMLLALCRTQKRAETLEKVLGDSKAGYPGLLLVACGEWDQEKRGPAVGPVWWDVRGKRQRLTLVEALRGM